MHHLFPHHPYPFDHRQQVPQGQPFFPGPPWFDGGIERRLRRIENELERLTRQVNRLERRVERLEGGRDDYT